MPARFCALVRSFCGPTKFARSANGEVLVGACAASAFRQQDCLLNFAKYELATSLLVSTHCRGRDRSYEGLGFQGSIGLHSARRTFECAVEQSR